MNDDEKQLIRDLAEGKVLTPNMAKARERQASKNAKRLKFLPYQKDIARFIADDSVKVDSMPVRSQGKSFAKAAQRRMAKLKQKLDRDEERRLIRRAAKALR